MGAQTTHALHEEREEIYGNKGAKGESSIAGGRGDRLDCFILVVNAHIFSPI